jgi:hypothetical protein
MDVGGGWRRRGFSLSLAWDQRLVTLRLGSDAAFLSPFGEVLVAVPTRRLFP